MKEVGHTETHMLKLEDEHVFPSPKFIQPLSDVSIVEGSRVRFEAKIDPATDPSIQIEWLLGNQVLRQSMDTITIKWFMTNNTDSH